LTRSTSNCRSAELTPRTPRTPPSLDLLDHRRIGERRRVAERPVLGDAAQEPAHDLPRPRLRQLGREYDVRRMDRTRTADGARVGAELAEEESLWQRASPYLTRSWFFLFLLALIGYFWLSTPSGTFLTGTNLKQIALTTSEVTLLNDGQTKAARQTSALLAAHPNLKGIFAMNVVSGNGVTQAVKAAGKAGKVKLVEFDAGPPQVQALKAGTISALIAQYPYGIGSWGRPRFGGQRLVRQLVAFPLSFSRSRPVTGSRAWSGA
jgi:Periplasmic binding protein domain